MAEYTNLADKPDDRTLEIERVFDASRELIFKAWTDPEIMMHWFCCKDFEVLSSEVDLRVGGKWRSSMKSPEGNVFVEAGIYHEIVKPERLVMSWKWEVTGGDEPCQIGYETIITLTFEVVDGNKTKMIFRQELFETVEARDSHKQGWTEVFDNLNIYLNQN